MCLHGDNGVSDSPLVSSLYTADILHPKFEGLGLRSPSDKVESVIEYDALSYSWGIGESAKIIICNGFEFPITENLFEALRALRHSQEQFRYLWVDAICINQSDDNEKGEQVWNMLEIYQKATRVIAWLSAAQEDIENVLVAASVVSLHLSPNKVLDFWSIHAGMSYLYTRPWFKRLWVQQEIFAARKLRLQCGQRHFKWSRLLSEPKLLSNLPHLRPYSQPEEDKGKGNKKSGTKFPDQIAVQFDAISWLDQLHMHHLTCFEQFSPQNRLQPDFIETLLSTGILSVTNPRDYIYGIIGMTGFPAKAMPLQEWMMARQQEVFIPIDYSADLTAILSTVTWAALMKGGLALLAKFKAFTPDHDGTCEQPLPSWVIDWRLSARLFSWTSSRPKDSLITREDTDMKLENAWARHIYSTSPANGLGRFIPRPPPDSHRQFCDDNKDRTVPPTKLILRGTPDPRFYAKGKCVWEKRQLLKDKAVWHLEFDVYTTDLIVRMHGFIGLAFKGLSLADHYDDNSYWSRQYSSGGLWLLRPAGADEFKLIACLSWVSNIWRSLYENWKWDPGHFQETSPQGRPVNQCHRLATDPERPMSDYGSLTDEDRVSTNTRKFTII